MKMAKRRRAISLQQAIDLCLESCDSDLDSSIEDVSCGEED